MRLWWLVALLVAAGCGSGRAASFDCRRAAGVVERAVCADPKLSALDERALAAYTAAAAALGVGEAPDYRDPVAGLLLAGNRDWGAARDRCGAANCLLELYLRRIGVLGFRPDAQAPTRLDGLIGRYGTIVEPARELVVMRGGADSVLVRATVGVGEAGCSFNGIGRSDGRGGLLVTHVDFDATQAGDHAIRLAPTRLGLGLSHAVKGDDVSARFCGGGGSLEQPFPRRTE